MTTISKKDFNDALRTRMKAVWPYTVDIGTDKDHLNRAENWCAENCEGQFGRFPKHNVYTFKFKNEKDAMMFSLIFSRTEDV